MQCVTMICQLDKFDHIDVNDSSRYLNDAGSQIERWQLNNELNRLACW